MEPYEIADSQPSLTYKDGHGMWFNLIKLETIGNQFIKYVKDTKLTHSLLIVKC